MSGKRKYCGHCQEYVTLRTYRNHEKLFFHRGKGLWKKCDDSSDEESNTGNNDGHEVEEHEEEIQDSSTIPLPHNEEEEENCVEVDHMQDSTSQIPGCSDDDCYAADSFDDLFMEHPLNPEVWDITEEEINADLHFHDSIPHVETGYGNVTQTSLKSISRWTLVFLFLWAAHCSISDAAVEILLAFIHVLFDVLGTVFPPLAMLLYFCQEPFLHFESILDSKKIILLNLLLFVGDA